MRNHPRFNFDNFFSAEAEVEALGYTPVSPARMDILAGFDPFKLPEDHDWSAIPQGFDLQAAIRRDLDAVQECEAIYMLRNWNLSEGAIAERAVAKWLNKKIIYQEEPVWILPVIASQKAIAKVMEEGLGKHERDSWLKESPINHSLKCSRHAITHTLQDAGLSPADGECHLELAVTRAAMALAQYQEDSCL